MSVGRLPADEYKTVGQIFAIMSSVAIASISVYHMYMVHKHVPSKCHTTSYSSMLLLFFAVLEILSITLEIFDEFHTELFCLYSKLVSVPAYLVFKCIIYLTLVKRTYSAFGDSPYAVWSKKKLKIWALVLITWSLLNVIFSAATTETEFDPNGYPKCFTFVFRPFLVSMMALDIISCGINLYLFIKPVKLLSAEISKITANAGAGGDENSNITRLQHVAIKQCTLSTITVVTSVFTSIFIALFSLVQVFVGLDVNISTLCVILMYKWNDYLVIKLCCLWVKDTNQSLVNKKNLEITNQSLGAGSSGDKKKVASNTSRTATPIKAYTVTTNLGHAEHTPQPSENESQTQALSDKSM